MNYRWHLRHPSVWKGIVAGLAGGLAGAWAMNQFQKGYAKASEALSAKNGHGNSHERKSKSEPNPPDATMVTADRVSRSFLGHPLTRKEQEKSGALVHYAFASAVGSAYGAAAEYAPAVKKLAGVPFGAALFVGADELALPALKLSKGPRAYPLSTHLYGLSSHIVYGLTIELVRRGVRAALGS